MVAEKMINSGFDRKKPAQAPQPPQHIGQMTPEDPAIRMDFVNNHILQLFKELHPDGVMGQYARMQNVRIRYHDLPRRADGPSARTGEVAIEGMGADIGADRVNNRIQLAELILRQSFGRKKIQRAASGRWSIASSTADCKHMVLLKPGRYHHIIFAGVCAVTGRTLVRIQPGNAARGEMINKPSVKPVRIICITAFDRIKLHPVTHILHKGLIAFDIVNQLAAVHGTSTAAPSVVRRLRVAIKKP
jgi:hypothetical protein